MKVLICIPCLLIGGTEIQTLSLINTLVSGGHQVTTVCYFEHSSDMIRQYRKAGSEVVLLQKTGKRIHGWKLIPFLWHGLRRILKNVHPDIVHVQYMAPGAIPLLMIRLMGYKQLLATLHTSADIYKSLRLIHFLQRYIVRAFICITQRAEESFFGSSVLYTRDYLILRRNHFTIYNALPSYIAIKETPREFSRNLTIGVVSRLEKIKGMDLIIPAFSIVHSHYPNLRLLIVGDGSLSLCMKKQAEAHGIEDCIEWTGRQQQNVLQDYYDKIDILCMPSRSEGFGLTAIEGMARGCVLVASQTGGLTEIIPNQKVGLLHPVEDIDAMAACIESIVKNKDLLNQYSARALQHVRCFSGDCYGILFKDLYTRLKCLY